MESLWERTSSVAAGNKSKKERDKVLEILDSLFDITTCQHEIKLCEDETSGCRNPSECVNKAHIQCDCPAMCKLPVMELRWMYYQRLKKTEKSQMMMSNTDKEETKRQTKAEERKVMKEMAEKKRKEKEEKQRLEQKQQEEAAKMFMDEEEEVQTCNETYRPKSDKQASELHDLIEDILEERLGEYAYLVTRYLYPEKPKRNTMSISNTAKAVMRTQTSSPAAAVIATSFLKDLIEAGYLSSEMSYLAVDPSKI